MHGLWRFIKKVVHWNLVVLGAVVLTLLVFMVLPLMQVIGQAPEADTTLQTVATVDTPPPPPLPEEEPEKEPEPEDKPPELTEESPPLDLSQLEMALNAGAGDGIGSGDFAVKLPTDAAQAGDSDSLFSLSDLDQQPRVLYQPAPNLDAKQRKTLLNAPATVYIIFIVDQRGRVENPMVQKSSDPLFDQTALNAVKQWKFEPGKRNGQPVRFRMRVPITFPKGK